MINSISDMLFCRFYVWLGKTHSIVSGGEIEGSEQFVPGLGHISSLDFLLHSLQKAVLHPIPYASYSLLTSSFFSFSGRKHDSAELMFYKIKEVNTSSL